MAGCREPIASDEDPVAKAHGEHGRPVRHQTVGARSPGRKIRKKMPLLELK